MESTLINEIEKIREEINRQMKITMDLTLQYRPSNRKTFLEIENSKFHVKFLLLNIKQKSTNVLKKISFSNFIYSIRYCFLFKI